MGLVMFAIVSLIISAAIFVKLKFNIIPLLIWGAVLFTLSELPNFIDIERKEIKVSEVEIQSLQVNTDSEGSIFLGSGKILGEDYYYYMVEDEKGFKMKKVKSELTYVNEVDEGNYRVEEYKSVGKTAFVNFFYGSELERTEYIFHIPKGSSRHFKVELE